MPQRILMSLKNISAVVGIAVGCFGALQAYAVLPLRVSLLDKKQEMFEQKMDKDHDLLIQIAQDVKYLKERMK